MWIIQPYTSLDKRIEVTGPGEIRFFVDYDDVNHEEVDKELTEMIDKLNS